MDMEIEGRNPKGHPKLTWRQVVRQDLELMEVQEKAVLDRDFWSFRMDCMRYRRTYGSRGCRGASIGMLVPCGVCR